MLLHFLKNCFATLSRRNLYFVILNWLFFASIVVGAFLAQFNGIGHFWVPFETSPFQVGVSNGVVMVVTIFLYNLILSNLIIITLPGAIFFAVPAGFLCLKGLLVGIFLSNLSTARFLVALPTIVLEGEGYVLAALAGVILGLSWLLPKYLWRGEKLSRFEFFKSALKECLHIYVIVAIFLFAAAVVEAITIVFMKVI
jgi:hypothetical protein